MNAALSCVHPSAYFYVSKRPLAEDWALVSEPSPVPLEVRGGDTIFLAATQSFRMRRHKGQWKCSTEEYIYNITDEEDPRKYMFAWHWHPNQWPDTHMHVNAQLSNGMKLDGRHIPTARIAFEEVLRFLIAECEVEPAKETAEWRTVLDETQERYEKFRTWFASVSQARPPCFPSVQHDRPYASP